MFVLSKLIFKNLWFLYQFSEKIYLSVTITEEFFNY